MLNGRNDQRTRKLNKIYYFQVFYGATTDSSSVFVFWVINNEVNLSRIRYQLPGAKYRVMNNDKIYLHNAFISTNDT